MLLAAAAAPVPLPAPVPPPRHGSVPAVSPDGKRIAFASERDQGMWSIYLMDADGSHTVRLTSSPGVEGPPAWSNGGRRIAYKMTHGDTARLTSIGLDGKDTRTLVTLVAKFIAMSHDGKCIAYTVGSWTRNRLMLADADGSNARALTDSAGACYNLAWSPDDHWIACTRVDSLRDMQVWVMSSDGAEAHPVTRFSASDGRPQGPAWSPDRRRIAIQAAVSDRQNPANTTGHLWLIDLSTGAATKLAAHDRPYLDETPSWFPDGKRLAFQSNRTGRMEIWVMGDDGTGAQQLTK